MPAAPFVRDPLSLLEIGNEHAARPGAERGSLDPPEARRRRARLVEALIVAGDLRTEPVIEAMRRVPRHLFVPGVEEPFAYENIPLPIGLGQTISQPAIIAMMTELLELTGLERVLEIGTGSGYQTAILSLLAQEVLSMERVPDLAADAEARLRRLGFERVTVRVGDGYEGWPERAPFDRILLTAAPHEVPRALVDQLADGGLLVAPVGGAGYQELLRGRKVHGRLRCDHLGGVAFVPMIRGPSPRLEDETGALAGEEDEGLWS
jgi:protein-L-isoaspartate(D-aspartate) O-methyltransferase